MSESKPPDKPVSIYAAKTHLSRLIARVEKGEEIVIARNGRPVARLVPERWVTGKRHWGTEAGLIVIGDDFNAPLPDEIIDAFYDSKLFPE